MINTLNSEDVWYFSHSLLPCLITTVDEFKKRSVLRRFLVIELTTTLNDKLSIDQVLTSKELWRNQILQKKSSYRLNPLLGLTLFLVSFKKMFKFRHSLSFFSMKLHRSLIMDLLSLWHCANVKHFYDFKVKKFQKVRDFSLIMFKMGSWKSFRSLKTIWNLAE